MRTFYTMSGMAMLCAIPLMTALTFLPQVTVAAEGALLEPAVRYKLPGKLKETSGLAEAEGLYWTVNDSGGKAVIYGFDPDTGKIQYRVRLKGVKNIDWEDLAQDKQFLYVADIGNNGANRSLLTIHRVSKAALKQGHATVNTIKLSFADFKSLYKAGDRQHNLDSEAIARVGSHIWLFTKNRGNQKTRLYKIHSNVFEHQSVEPQAEYPVQGLVTAADFNPQTNELALLTYGYGPLFGQTSIWRVPVVNEMPDWPNAVRHPVKDPGQWESILWQGGDRVLLTAERSFFGAQRLAEVKF